ncbi:DUF3885 domain-containing protein [Flindersiella endophytica]
MNRISPEEVNGSLHHTYDGGADCILDTTAERDRLRAAHPGWLSRHPQGL